MLVVAIVPHAGGGGAVVGDSADFGGGMGSIDAAGLAGGGGAIEVVNGDLAVLRTVAVGDQGLTQQINIRRTENVPGGAADDLRRGKPGLDGLDEVGIPDTAFLPLRGHGAALLKGAGNGGLGLFGPRPFALLFDVGASLGAAALAAIEMAAGELAADGIDPDGALSVNEQMGMRRAGGGNLIGHAPVGGIERRQNVPDRFMSQAALRRVLDGQHIFAMLFASHRGFLLYR